VVQGDRASRGVAELDRGGRLNRRTRRQPFLDGDVERLVHFGSRHHNTQIELAGQVNLIPQISGDEVPDAAISIADGFFGTRARQLHLPGVRRVLVEGQLVALRCGVEQKKDGRHADRIGARHACSPGAWPWARTRRPQGAAIRSDFAGRSHLVLGGFDMQPNGCI
jgi:hypothetical protein